MTIKNNFNRIKHIIIQNRMYYMKSIGSRKIREFVPKECVDLLLEVQSTQQIKAQNLSEKCMICLSDMDKKTERLWTCTTCKKAFHNECTGLWVKSCHQHNETPTCPNCRQVIHLFDKTLLDNSSKILHTRLYNLSDSTVTINNKVYKIHKETLSEKLKAINTILNNILKKACRQDLLILEKIKRYLDTNAIDSSKVQAKIDSFGYRCCIS
jgi:hypothetical protein